MKSSSANDRAFFHQLFGCGALHNQLCSAQALASKRFGQADLEIIKKRSVLCQLNKGKEGDKEWPQKSWKSFFEKIMLQYRLKRNDKNTFFLSEAISDLFSEDSVFCNIFSTFMLSIYHTLKTFISSETAEGRLSIPSQHEPRFTASP